MVALLYFKQMTQNDVGLDIFQALLSPDGVQYFNLHHPCSLAAFLAKHCSKKAIPTLNVHVKHAF